MTTLLGQHHGYVPGVDGIRLHYRTWEVARPRASLLLVHGLGEHSGRYQRFATRMATHGFASFALDLRGHGRSEGRRGHVARFDTFLQEVERFRREVSGLTDPDCPLFLLGHSMGGLIALRYVQEYAGGVGGAILCSPWMATAALPVARWKTLVAPLLSPVLPALPLTSRVDPDLLSRDPLVVESYRGDPLVHDIMTPRLFTEVSEAIGQVLRRSERITVPLLFLLGGEDRLVRPDRAVAFSRATGREDEVVILRGLYHEVLNEPGAGEAEDAIRGWLAARASA